MSSIRPNDRQVVRNRAKRRLDSHVPVPVPVPVPDLLSDPSFSLDRYGDGL
jgi:hypothetical protein